MQGATFEAERRERGDRRLRPTSLRAALLPGGRRRICRRRHEARDAYVDCPSPRTVCLTVFLIIASGFDAFLTLLHIGGGASEANPIMGLALAQGIDAFLILKIGLTSLGAWFLAVHQNFGMGAMGLRCMAVTYTVLLAYHLALFAV
jgi:hypothetical protein